jgi:hypothetical protein
LRLDNSRQQVESAKKWLKIRDKSSADEDMAVQLCAPVTTDENGIL